MSKRILVEKAQAILDAAAKVSQRKLARRFNVARGTIQAILHASPTAPARYKYGGVELVDFKPLRKSVFCHGCQAFVKTAPCPACLARFAPPQDADLAAEVSATENRQALAMPVADPTPEELAARAEAVRLAGLAAMQAKPPVTSHPPPANPRVYGIRTRSGGKLVFHPEN